ncbi:MAG: hypothetical protein ACRD9R_11905, partial [Pyrinomonadaceae bacterium]
MSNLPLIRPRPLAAALFFCCALALTPDAAAQRSRTVSDGTNSKPQPAAAKDAPAPVTPQPVKAKYEGGVFGYAKKQTGTLNFDDPSDRLVFRDKKGSEYVSLPYKAIVAAFPDTQSRRPTAATVAGSIPVPYGLNFPA